MTAVVFLHAHPDDEAIFTGGTIALLSQRQTRVVVVVATNGDVGAAAEVREAETRAAGALLGVGRLEFLGYGDSGMAGESTSAVEGTFAETPRDEAASRVAAVLRDEAASALVVYDEHGIYGHPDHVKVHDVGVRAAELAGVGCVYEATVDREYLHFVETHLVVEAGVPGGKERPAHDLGLAGSALGVPTVAITTTVDVHPVLDVKRAAMAAHASQIPETASPMRLPAAAFRDVYGFEWYVRRGPPGFIDELTLE